MTDDLGRLAVPRETARALLAEHAEDELRRTRARQEAERRAEEEDRAWRNSLPRPIPAGAIPEGMTAGMLMMARDPDRAKSKRETMVEHALQHPSGSIVYHALNNEAS